MTFIATDTGEWVDENYERLARMLQDYSPTLELRYIPSDKRTRDDKKPYQVVNRDANGLETVVCYASELDSPVDILTTVFNADNKHGNVLDRIEAHNRAQELFKLKEKDDQLTEALDLARFMFKTPLHYIKMGRDSEGKQIKFDDTRRRI
jgi:hypothetical protein